MRHFGLQGQIFFFSLIIVTHVSLILCYNHKLCLQQPHLAVHWSVMRLKMKTTDTFRSRFIKSKNTHTDQQTLQFPEECLTSCLDRGTNNPLPHNPVQDIERLWKQLQERIEAVTSDVVEHLCDITTLDLWASRVSNHMKRPHRFNREETTE